MTPLQLFHYQVKQREEDTVQNIITNVAVFYKIPRYQLLRDAKFSEIKEAYIDILYQEKNLEDMN